MTHLLEVLRGQLLAVVPLKTEGTARQFRVSRQVAAGVEGPAEEGEVRHGGAGGHEPVTDPHPGDVEGEGRSRLRIELADLVALPLVEGEAGRLPGVDGESAPGREDDVVVVPALAHEEELGRLQGFVAEGVQGVGGHGHRNAPAGPVEEGREVGHGLGTARTRRKEGLARVGGQEMSEGGDVSCPGLADDVLEVDWEVFHVICLFPVRILPLPGIIAPGGPLLPSQAAPSSPGGMGTPVLTVPRKMKIPCSREKGFSGTVVLLFDRSLQRRDTAGCPTRPAAMHGSDLLAGTVPPTGRRCTVPNESINPYCHDAVATAQERPPITIIIYPRRMYDLKFFLRSPKKLGPAINPTDVTNKIKPSVSIILSAFEI